MRPYYEPFKFFLLKGRGINGIFRLKPFYYYREGLNRGTIDFIYPWPEEGGGMDQIIPFVYASGETVGGLQFLVDK